MTVFAEEAMALVGEHRGRLWHGRLLGAWQGGPGSVEFDWRWALEREELRGDVIGFFHTHPVGFARPSARDVRTMRAWAECFGKPLLCAIDSGGRLVAAVFEDGTAPGRPVKAVERFSRGVLVAVD